MIEKEFTKLKYSDYRHSIWTILKYLPGVLAPVAVSITFSTLHAQSLPDRSDPATAAAITFQIKHTDFDGDGASDIVVWREQNAAWYVLTSASDFRNSMTRHWGNIAKLDQITPGDYDGDGISDMAVQRGTTNEWFVLTSASNFTDSFTVSLERGGRPVPGDYDGDGVTDIAVWSTSTAHWYVSTSRSNFNDSIIRQWGTPDRVNEDPQNRGDIPVPGDYDGDGATDMAVWRPAVGIWSILTSSTEFRQAFHKAWGRESARDIPVPGDFDGDGINDLAVWRIPTGA